MAESVHFEHLSVNHIATTIIIIILMYSQYIYLLLLYPNTNKHLFNFNNEIYKYKTGALNNLYLLAVNLTKYNKCAYISGIKVFNHLPQTIKMLQHNWS
jgi:hypothetical protein